MTGNPVSPRRTSPESRVHARHESRHHVKWMYASFRFTIFERNSSTLLRSFTLQQIHCILDSMSLKRKRSGSALSPSSSSSSLGQTSRDHSSSPRTYGSVGRVSDFSQELNSRTLKRYRDSRPDEDTVYSKCLPLLSSRSFSFADLSRRTYLQHAFRSGALPAPIPTVSYDSAFA